MLADTVVTAQHRGAIQFRGRGCLVAALRPARVSDAFRPGSLPPRPPCQARSPVLPRLFHRLSMMLAPVSIGDPVGDAHPGVYIVHGQAVLDGIVEIHPGG